MDPRETLGDRKRRLHVDGNPKRIKMRRFQKYPDTRGHGLRFPSPLQSSMRDLRCRKITFLRRMAKKPEKDFNLQF